MLRSLLFSWEGGMLHCACSTMQYLQLAPQRGNCSLGLFSCLGPRQGRSVAEGRVERPERSTHTLQQLFLIWNTFFIKDTPSIQLTNGYTRILWTAELYTHDCTGHQWRGSPECSSNFQTLSLPLAKGGSRVCLDIKRSIIYLL